MAAGRFRCVAASTGAFELREPDYGCETMEVSWEKSRETERVWEAPFNKSELQCSVKLGRTRISYIAQGGGRLRQRSHRRKVPSKGESLLS
jgi:hypothetical protein